MKTITLLALLLGGCSREHHYTCAEILGSPPRINFVKILPAGWKVSIGTEDDHRVWNNNGRLVCDHDGHDVVYSEQKP